MAQFDVYRNPVGSMKYVPYVVDVQADHLERMPTRVIIPLGVPGPLLQPTSRLNPVVTLDDEEFILVTEHMTSLPTNVLRHKVGSLASHRYDLINALDFVFTGI